MRPVLLLLISCTLLPSGGSSLVAQETVSPEVQALYEHAQAAQAANSPETAISDYRHILKLAPNLPQAYNNLGRLYFNLGRYGEAAAVLKQGLTVAPEMHGAQIMLGASLLELGQATNAIPPLEAGVQAMPADRFARMTLVHALIGANRPQEALPQLDALLKADPRDQEAWYTLGKLHLQLSEQALSQVQAIDPNTPLAHELAGEVMESMQNTPGAVSEYKQAIAAAPDNVGALQHLADLYWSTGDWPHARDGYQALLLRQPGNCMAHWRLSNALDELGDATQAALGEVNKALDGCPALAEAHAERARLLLRTGKPSEALTDLKLAEAAAPDEPSVQRLLAQAYRALGDQGKAEQANQRFQQLDQEQHAAKERHAASVVQANR
jgi:tetratricopeptide (TPR) repeat protein